ncbi:MAG TPA: phytoene/squalene synthase family protein, partial [Longimicrobium sp.]|nr:phytoene/squalene synthase family protein [Longimicrobium sp.]
HALLLPGDPVLDAFAEQWLRRAMAAVSRERRGRCAARRVEAASHIRARVPGAAEWPAYFARNSRSFRFAARFLPAAEAERVARVYAYCRVTDDLVDRPVDGAAPWLERVLDEWVELSRRAYEGRATGLDLLDRAMGEMASAGVPFRYAAELAEGMRMDLRRQAYADTGELRTYTYRVASVVGLWLTELSGVHDPPTLRRAAAMGHAMQLTNILRDVGEDRRAGRLYLPADRLRAHGVTVEEIDRTLAGAAPVSTRYAALVAELMRGAEAEYALGFAAIPRLPRWFQAPVAVAAHVYRAIHGSIRRNGCDNLRLRARTGPAVKALAAVQAMWDLRRARGALAAGFELEPSEALVAWSPAP